MTVSRHLHWWSAGLVVFGFALAWVMVALPLSQLLVKFLLYQVHKTVGITVFALAVVRLAMVRRPRGMRLILLALLLIVPILGYLTAATSVTGVPTLFLGFISIPHIVPPNALWCAILTAIHRALAVALILLAGWHAVTMVRRTPGE